MEYKKYINNENQLPKIPAVTKRRWKTKNKESTKRKCYKNWLIQSSSEVQSSETVLPLPKSCLVEDSMDYFQDGHTHSRMDTHGQTHDNEEEKRKNKNEEKICSGARITETESVLSVLCFALRHKLSKTALNDLLALINLYCPAHINAVPDSKHKFFKFFEGFNDSVDLQFCCPNCQSYFGKEVLAQCMTCGNIPGDNESLIKRGSVFLTMSLKKQLEKKMADKNFCQALNYRWSRTKLSTENYDIYEIYDSTMYQSVENFNDPSKLNLSLSWNVDGVPIFKSSSFHIWPLQVIINELPPNLRKENILLGGLWFGSTRPDMNTFLQAFVEECTLLERQGLTCEWKGQKTVLYVYNLMCVCDSVARCLVQNVKQFNLKLAVIGVAMKKKWSKKEMVMQECMHSTFQNQNYEHTMNTVSMQHLSSNLMMLHCLV
ncbi:uncharacterized protein LOC117972660 [Acipenser ruthenus]|uniref:uncharacterized protein LOC117972660 n=1 Tax=Acipenser ruthenus TaxID=7906 RepID=UPI002740B456|nr:uncharacterized protein LOC117972660 [Acipenser ruthenus]